MSTDSSSCCKRGPTKGASAESSPSREPHDSLPSLSATPATSEAKRFCAARLACSSPAAHCQARVAGRKRVVLLVRGRGRKRRARRARRRPARMEQCHGARRGGMWDVVLTNLPQLEQPSSPSAARTSTSARNQPPQPPPRQTPAKSARSPPSPLCSRPHPHHLHRHREEKYEPDFINCLKSVSTTRPLRTLRARADRPSGASETRP